MIVRAGVYLALAFAVMVSPSVSPRIGVAGAVALSTLAVLPVMVPRLGSLRALPLVLTIDLVVAYAVGHAVASELTLVLVAGSSSLAVMLLGRRTAARIVGLAIVLELARLVPLVTGRLAGDEGAGIIEVVVRVFAIGVLVAGSAVLMDLVRRNHAALTESRTRFEALLEVAPVGVVQIRNGAIEYANPEANRLLGALDGPIDERFPTEVVAGYHDLVASDRQRTSLQRIERNAGSGRPAVLEVTLTVLHRGRDVVVQAVFTDVTERARAEEALREAEHRFRSAFTRAATPFVMTEADLVMSDVNEAFADLVGRPRAELIGTRWTEVVDPDSHRLVLEFGWAAMEGRQDTFSADVGIIRSDGSRRRCVLDVAVLAGSDGRPSRFFALVHDITERLAVQEALEDSERRYRSLFERIPVALYRTRPDGEIMEANAALRELIGGDDDANVVGLDAHDFYVRDGERERLTSRVMDEGLVDGAEEELIRLDGSTVWVSDSSRLVETDEGTFFEGALVDITARRRVEAELRMRAMQQESVAALGQYALEGVDLDQVFERAMATLGSMLDVETTALHELRRSGSFVMRAGVGWPPGARLLTRSLVSRTVGTPGPIVLRSAEEVRFAVPELGEAGYRSGVSVMVPGVDRPFGAIWAFSTTERVFSSDDLNFIVATANVLAAAIDRSRSRERLEELVRSKDEFIASVSHELRTPLTVVTGMAHEMRDRWREFQDDEMAEFTRLLAEQSMDLADLIEDLLVAARADIGKVSVHPTDLDVAAEIEAVVASLGRGATKRIVVEPFTGRLRADPVRMRQILRNLITNAIRYGGPTIEIACEDRGEAVAILVRDDGPGIPDDRRDVIFAPYERAHDHTGQPGSVGLGLTVSRTLAELMGGALRYRYDGGSVFELSLPASARTMVEVPIEAPDPPTAGRSLSKGPDRASLPGT